MKKTMIIFFLWVSCHCGYASMATLICPPASSLTFSQIDSDEYLVTAQPVILTGNLPYFELKAKTNVNKANTFMAMSYQRQNEEGKSQFECIYSADKGSIINRLILQVQGAEMTQWCFMPSSQNNHCQGDRFGCYLQCEVL